MPFSHEIQAFCAHCEDTQVNPDLVPDYQQAREQSEAWAESLSTDEHTYTGIVRVVVTPQEE